MFVDTEGVEATHRGDLYAVGRNQFGDGPQMIGEFLFDRWLVRFLLIQA
jgi:hypothetical protein